MSIHKEIHLEDEICADLTAAGWLYDAADAGRYDRTQALFVDDAVAWIKVSQPKAWEAIEKSHGAAAPKVVAERLRKSLDSQGTLAVLRQGFEMIGLKHAVAMCQFKPALAMNADLQARYAANRLRVVRQVHYSVHNENSIDLVLFINGIPVATAELKSHYTQSVQDAVYQYKTDREPFFKPKNVAEPLLAFPGGALVHFAVSNAAAEMTTRLAGLDTIFLPFNRGNAGGAGNPPKAGIATDYLWKEVWQRDSFLQILGRYLVPVKNAKKQLVGWIFPRYHQLTVTRKLVAAVTLEGPGNKYLVQHSAGSGKTNSIAWTAHFLADLHDAKDGKVFDTVIVISDRTVLDDQLREAIMSFERTQGVVAVITGEGASKSKELAEALSAGKKILVCTVQTFPFALEEVRKLAATKGKRFAVIVDEAHSSQTNQTAAKLKMVLSAAEMAELLDGGGVSAEDILAAQMAAKAGDDEKAGITYVAFTATPKDKTLQLFGTRPDPTRKPAPDNIPAPFHVHSMRQAIEEGFILDVLKTYTSYKVAFSLAHEGKTIESNEVDKSEAMKGIMGWVRLHEYNIAQRVQVVVEHYRKHVASLLGGQAKAMVVTSSRKEAVRWQKATRKYIAEHGYKIEALVAFSGEVIDLDSGPDPFTEHSKELNPKLGGQDIRTAFKGGDYELLIVANKFQTGFDEPLLCAMYVDKRLGGIQAVQTLSRLNRCYPGKDQTYVVDFVNDPTDILAAFKPYFETAELSGVTDPYIVNELKAKLDGQALYDTFEVDRVVNVALRGTRAKPSQLDAATTPVASRLLGAYAEAKKAFETAGGDTKKEKTAKDTMDSLILFKSDMAAYVRIYGFLSQIFDYGNTDIEKRSIFFRLLYPLLTYGREREGVDLSALKLTAYTIKSIGDPTLSLASGDQAKIDPTDEGGSGEVQDKAKIALSELIDKVNDLFEGDLTPGDKLVYVNDVIKGKLMESEKLAEQAANNTKEQFDNSPDLDKELEGAIMDALEAHSAMSKQALSSAALRADLKSTLLGAGKLWEGLRERATKHRHLHEIRRVDLTPKDVRHLSEQLRDISDEETPAMRDAAAAENSLVTVFFGTDRADASPESVSTFFGNKRGDSVTVGTVTVSIPKVHKLGRLERPSWLRLQFSEDLSKHIVLLAIERLTAEAFYRQMNAALLSKVSPDAFVFVHGYNVSFENAALRTAQIAVDIGLQSVPIMYSWPSQGGVASYTIDEANSEWARANLYAFFEQLATRLVQAKEIVVIAHSMGSRPVTWALQELVQSGAVPAGKFRQLVLAAPDIDADVFKRDILPKLKVSPDSPSGMRITMYASSKDKALGASKLVHGSPRLGESGPALVVDSSMETIDASAIDTDFLGHSYVINDRALLADLTVLLGQDLSAAQRGYLQVHMTPYGQHWAFKP